MKYSTAMSTPCSNLFLDFEKTAWLSAARTIRSSVISRSPTKADAVNGFQKWLGIRKELHQVQASKTVY